MAMNLVKSFEFFDPGICRDQIHIIGCGAVGSTLAEIITRLGIENITLYDFDVVEEKNIANQMFRRIDIGKTKTQALKEMLCEINPDLEHTIKIVDGYNGQQLSGYVFMAVDSVDVRREIFTKNKFNMKIKAMFDFRMGLTDAEHYAASWQDLKQKDNLWNSMQFSQEEADAAAPQSACNQLLSVAPTIRTICSFGVANFMNFVQKRTLKKSIRLDAFDFVVDAF